eukprot:1141321-Pelagomonas_calceolata.AAC.2
MQSHARLERATGWRAIATFCLHLPAGTAVLLGFETKLSQTHDGPAGKRALNSTTQAGGSCTAA